MTDFETVIFIDLDGTIMINPFERVVWPVVIGELVAQSGQSADAIYDMIAAENRARQDDDAGDPVLSMDWDDITATVAQRLGVRLTANVTDLVRTHAASHSSVMDHAPEVLRDLRAPGRALVVATKGLAKYQVPVLDALGLTSLFDAVLTPDTHGGLKKHRRFFGDWPQRARRALMVGDRYDDDVLYPGRHGFLLLWKPEALPPDLLPLDPLERARRYPYATDQPLPATAILASLRELPALVTRLEG